MEKYKEIEGFENYGISKTGEVINLKKKGSKPLKPYLISGYLAVGVCNENGRVISLVHRLVAEAYIPKIGYPITVKHKDGNKLNNDVSNLEWHKFVKRQYRVKGNHNKNSGEKHGSSKLKDQDVMFILNNSNVISRDQFAERFNVTKSTVSSILNNKSWTHISRENIPSPMRKSSKKFIDEDTGKQYNSKSEIAEALNVSLHTVDVIILGKSRLPIRVKQM